MKRSEAFPSNYLSKDDVAAPLTATIAGVKPVVLKGENGDEQKPVMYFAGEVKPLIVNNANWMTCEDLYGEDSDAWIGKSIEIYKDPNVMFGNKRVGGVRLRAPQQAAPVKDESPTAVWARYVEANHPTAEQIAKALGKERVSAWLAEYPAKTVYDAIELINRVKSDF